MNILNIQMLSSYQMRGTAVLLDGKRIYFKKRGGEYSYRCETDKDSIELTICRFLEINGKFWFLFSLLFFFISFLGIFDAHYDKNCRCLRYKTTLNIKTETNVKIAFNPFKENGAAVQCTSDSYMEECENEYYTDKQAKKRLKTMRIVKGLIWLALIIVGIVVGVIKLIG